MRPLLKFCGNKNVQDYKLTSKSAADYIGFVFVPGVKREVQPSQVAHWLENQPLDANKKIVALFVNASIDRIKEVVSTIPVDVIQCHGTESPQMVKEIKIETELTVWKVIHHQKNGIEKMQDFKGIVDGFIIDAKVDGKWGGTGHSFDWQVVPQYIQEGKQQNVPVFIAGGVDASNVSKLLTFQPDGIDVSSGIEHEGQKSLEAIRHFEGAVQIDNSLS